MAAQLHLRRQDAFPNPGLLSARHGIQRRCACGGIPGPTGECAECRRKREQGLTITASVSSAAKGDDLSTVPVSGGMTQVGAPVIQRLADDTSDSTASAGDAVPQGVEKTEDSDCTGWFSDRESTSKRAAEHYVTTELGGKRGDVETITCDLFNPDTKAYACTVHFSGGTDIRVIVRPDLIIVGVPPLRTMLPPADQPLCFYEYKCPKPNRDLILTKQKCLAAPPAGRDSAAGRKGPTP